MYNNTPALNDSLLATDSTALDSEELGNALSVPLDVNNLTRLSAGSRGRRFVSWREQARRPSGAVVMLCLNTGLEDALWEASKSLKSAISRSGHKCRLSAGTAKGHFSGRRQGTATHLFVAVL